MKKLMIAATLVMTAGMLLAAGGNTRNRRGAAKNEPVAEDSESVKEGEGDVVIRQPPKLGQQAWRQFTAPRVGGATGIGVVYKKPRYWIVLETEYQTMVKTMEQLTFTWHVLLDSKTATNKDKDAQKKLAPYSYFTQTVTYHNIPKGQHAASVCLHPSYLECYGEPKAVGLVVTNQNGEELICDTLSEVKGIAKGSKFWDDSKIMGATNENGPMIERRQGLLDRSKTIWALVNPDDYELVQ